MMTNEEFITKIQELAKEMREAYENDELGKADDLRERQVILIDLRKAGKI